MILRAYLSNGDTTEIDLEIETIEEAARVLSGLGISILRTEPIKQKEPENESMETAKNT